MTDSAPTPDRASPEGEKSPARARKSWLKRLLLLLFSLPLLLLGLVVVLLAVLFIRLSLGPVDLTRLAQRWEPVLISHSGLDGPLPVGALSWQKVLLSWSWHAPLEVSFQVAGLALGQPAMPAVDMIESVQVTLGLEDILRRQIALRAVQVSGVKLGLLQAGTGQLDLLPPGLTGATPPAGAASRHPAHSWLTLAGLRQLSLHRIRVDVQEADGTYPASPVHLAATDFSTRYQPGRGWAGHGVISVTHGNQKVLLTADLAPQGHGRTLWHVASTPVVPADFTYVIPSMQAGLVLPWHVPLSLQASGELVRTRYGFDRPVTAQLNVHLGEGYVTQVGPTGPAPPERLASGDATVNMVWGTSAPYRSLRVSVPQLRLVLLDAKDRTVPLEVDTEVALDDWQGPRRMDVELTAALGTFDFSTLGSIWPLGFVKGGRNWMVRNMTAGWGKDFRIHTHLTSATGPDDLKVAVLSGQLNGEDLTVWWLRPIQPVTGLAAQARFATNDPNTLVINLQHGKLADGHGGAVDVADGRVTLTSLLHQVQYGDIRLHLESSFASVLDILSHPRLHMLSRHPLPLSHPTGRQDGRLNIFLPLYSWVTMDYIDVSALIRCENLGADVRGVGPVRHTDGLLKLTSDYLAFKGSTLIRDIPITLQTWSNLDRPEPGVPLNRVSASAVLTPRDVAGFGLKLPKHFFTGRALVQGRLLQLAGLPHRGYLDVAAHADLTPAGITTLLWKKAPGQPAEVSAHARWTGGQLTALDDLQARGPGLQLTGRTLLRAGEVAGVQFPHFQLGRTEGTLLTKWPVSRAPELPYVVALQANVLDASPLFETRAPNSGARKPPATGTTGRALLPKGRWQLSMDVGKIYYKPQAALDGVQVRASWDRQQLAQGLVNIAGPYRVHAAITPDPRLPAVRQLKADGDDLGGLFATLGMTRRFSGGKLELDGRFAPDPQGGGAGLGLGLPPFKGRLIVRNFALNNPPGILRFLAHLSFAHSDLLRDNRFGGLQLIVGLEDRDRVLKLANGLLANPIVGGTAAGTINLPRKWLDIAGTISPFYALNSLPGHIPVVGWVFAPQKGSGILAATYSVKGPLDKPKISVDPFTLLLPGILRLLVP
ncbi:AsmA-like C-terminal region-containing protein [Oecophyllibacter saccharovorans]|uniref:AsmA-like C-terminal domain-containing protein n=1 Tax=Oecophyllibacter saccharovorans TaxID=2558360 RepID=A0A506ULV7_9PROT|nr:AsmA-like C-terminal region-containing protein [Oecophyllibacter saccharovorans]TPW34326.1 hypothetical protein E3202_07490 [Oecophyllibacter saccharovorans]